MRFKAENANRKTKTKKGKLRRMFLFIIMGFIIIIAGKWMIENLSPVWNVNRLEKATVPDWVDVQIIEVNGDSRRGEKLTGINDIVIHYVGNPGSTAQQNHDYYSRAEAIVSSHFVIGLDGKIIQCIPLNEKSSASNGRNGDTISIEVCHPNKTGKFTKESYDSLVKLTAWLSQLCNLKEEHIIRHYDITGKKCPLYFVQHEDKWKQFKEDVVKSMKKATVESSGS